MLAADSTIHPMYLRLCVGCSIGFNVATEKYEDLVKAGVVDPKKVTRTALQNAGSIAGLLLTTECIITEIPEKDPPMPAGGGGHDHGMM